MPSRSEAPEMRGASGSPSGRGWGTLSLTWKLTVPLGLVTVLWGLSATFLPLRDAGRTAALGVLAVLAVLVVAGAGLLVARGMVRRLQRVSKAAERIAGGDLSARADVTGGDEIGVLGASFNAMAERLQHSHELLEQRVGERTRDLTRANTELARIVRAKSEFLANISHELRTPLNAILGYSEVLSDQAFFGPPAPGDVQRQAGAIHQSGQHLLGLVNDLLDLAKVEAGKLDLHLEDVDFRATVNAVLVLMEPLARSKGQTLGVRFGQAIRPGSQATPVRADERRLRQILVNLLSNAVKFTPDGGSITLEIAESGRFLECTVADDGIGIAPEEQPRIFYPFLQVDGSYNRKQEGTGLGLSLTRELVELHGGRIWVESQKDRGSRFSFTIPLAHSVPRARGRRKGNAVPAEGIGGTSSSRVVSLDGPSEAVPPASPVPQTASAPSLSAMPELPELPRDGGA